MNSSRISEIEQLAAALAGGATLELYLTPKPGLVDRADRGSHPDLSLAVMEQSLKITAGYLEELKDSLMRGESFEQQMAIGQRTEQEMLGTLGTNTHKGYLFLSGLLLVAAWQTPTSNELSLRSTIAALAVDFFKAGEPDSTNGGLARGRYRAGGIVGEALNGLPSLFNEALPAYLAAIKRHNCFRRASFAMLGRLMQTVEDTTTLHRGGTFGLARIRRDGRELERIVAENGDSISFLKGLTPTISA